MVINNNNLLTSKAQILCIYIQMHPNIIITINIKDKIKIIIIIMIIGIQNNKYNS